MVEGALARGKVEREVGLPVGDRPAGRGVDVPVVRHQRVADGLRSAPVHFARDRDRKLGVVPGVTARGGLCRPVVEPRAPVVAQRFQHPEAPRRAALRLNHRVLRQRDEQVQHRVMIQPVSTADLLGVLEAERPGEDRQPPEQLLLVRGQQRVAGLDRRLERTAPAEDAEAVLEPLGDRGRRKRAHARGGKLNRERQAIDPVADLGDGVALGGVGDPVRPCRGGALHEQPLGGVRVERPYGHDRLAGEPQRPAAGHEDENAAARCSQLAGDGSQGRHEVLRVVEDDQQSGTAQPFAHDPEGVAVAVFAAGADPADAERIPDRGVDLVGTAQRPEVDEPRAVGHLVEQRPGRLRGEGRLTDAGGADERDEPVLAERARHGREVAVAPDDGRDPGADVGRVRRGSSGTSSSA